MTSPVLTSGGSPNTDSAKGAAEDSVILVGLSQGLPREVLLLIMLNWILILNSQACDVNVRNFIFARPLIGCSAGSPHHHNTPTRRCFPNRIGMIPQNTLPAGPLRVERLVGTVSTIIMLVSTAHQAWLLKPD